MNFVPINIARATIHEHIRKRQKETLVSRNTFNLLLNKNNYKQTPLFIIVEFGDSLIVYELMLCQLRWSIKPHCTSVTFINKSGQFKQNAVK